MSLHLAYESYQIPLGSTLTDMYNTLKTAIISRGWRILNDSYSMMLLQVLPNSTWTYSGYPVGGAWDGITHQGNNSFPPAANMITYNNVPPFWSGVQFVNPVDIRKVWLEERNNGLIAEFPTAFSLDYSDDGTSWTTLQSWAGIVWTEALTKEFVVTNGSTGAHAYWRINVTARGSGNAWTSVVEIRLFDASGNACSPNGVIFLDVIPPVSEDIGDTNGFDFCRITFTAGTIHFTPKVKYHNGLKQVVSFYSATAGNVIPSATVDGQTVAVSAGLINASNTGGVNLQLLCEALNASALSAFTNFTWELEPTMWIILGTRKTFGSSVVSGTNVSALIVSREVPAGYNGESWAYYEEASYFNQTKGVGVDLTNGFVYYLQVNNRTLGLATKTNSGFYGPMFLSYADHAQAISEMALNGDSRYCTPIELYLVWGPEGATHHQVSQTFLFPSKVRGRRNWLSARDGQDSNYTGSGAPRHVATWNLGFRNFDVDAKVHYSWTKFIDTSVNDTGSSGVMVPFGLYGSNYYHLQARGSLFSINFRGGYVKNNDSTAHTSLYVPPFSLPDVKRHITHNAVTNENALMAPDTSVETTLTDAIALADAPTTLAVGDVGGLPSIGAVSIMGEIFKYTGKSGNTLTGVTRSQYATTPRIIAAGSKVNPIAWYIKINDFALAAGYTRP